MGRSVNSTPTNSIMKGNTALTFRQNCSWKRIHNREAERDINVAAKRGTSFVLDNDDTFILVFPETGTGDSATHRPRKPLQPRPNKNHPFVVSHCSMNPSDYPVFLSFDAFSDSNDEPKSVPFLLRRRPFPVESPSFDSPSPSNDGMMNYRSCHLGVRSASTQKNASPALALTEDYIDSKLLLPEW